MSGDVDGALKAADEAWRRGDPVAAMRLAAVVTAHDPGNAAGWWLYANAAMAAGRMADAERGFGEGAKTVRAGTPGHVRFLIQRARPLMEEGRLAEAVGCVRAAVAAGMADPQQLVLAAFTLTHAGLVAEARPMVERAIVASPDDPAAWYNLGSIREFMGDGAGACAGFERAISASGGRFAAASYKLSHAKRWSADDNHIPALEQLECRTPQEAAQVAFSLFKEYDDVGDTAAAWDCLQHGTKIMHRLERWSSFDEAATVAAWRHHFPASSIAPVGDAIPRSGPRRIFVLGLPRSGTTLVERILAAHSQVHAMGEPKAFAIAVRRLTGLTDAPLLDARVVARAAGLDPAQIADFYTREMAPFDGGRAVTIDKRTQNVHYVALIRRAFPDAAIVALDRDPMDALFGAYKRLFSGSHGWSYAQEDLADHYRHHRTLVDHWASFPDLGLIRVTLEDLIADPEPQIRRLLAACGLPFEEACLCPHDAVGAVMTASASQVREPINSSGVGAWRRYARQLAPLEAALAADGFLPSATAMVDRPS